MAVGKYLPFAYSLLRSGLRVSRPHPRQHLLSLPGTRRPGGHRSPRGVWLLEGPITQTKSSSIANTIPTTVSGTFYLPIIFSYLDRKVLGVGDQAGLNCRGSGLASLLPCLSWVLQSALDIPRTKDKPEPYGQNPLEGAQFVSYELVFEGPADNLSAYPCITLHIRILLPMIPLSPSALLKHGQSLQSLPTGRGLKLPFAATACLE